ncbi:MAG: hypothetical protein ACXACI_03245 [Candidatus Hodarchaeales archaeon]
MHLNNVLRYLVILLTVLVIAISVLPVSATPSAISGNAEPKKSLQVTENAEREYFNLSSFRGAEQHNFTVDRRITVLKHGGVLFNTTFFLKIAEEATESFNTINFTISNEEFDSIYQYSITHTNGSTKGFSVIEDRQENNTILSVLIPTVRPGNEIRFTINENYGTYVEQNPASESTLAFNGIFNHSFHPWVSIPLTEYSIYVEIEPPLEEDPPVVVAGSLRPTGLGTGNFTPTSNKIEITNVSALPTFNLSLYNESLEYNLTALQDTKFIPAYDPQIGENLTLFLSFNFTAQTPPVQYESFRRIVEIDQWKKIKVTEEIEVRNLAGNGSEFPLVGKLGYFLLIVPDPVEYISGYDSFGNLSVTKAPFTITYRGDLEVTHFEIRPRIRIQGNDTYKFSITYTRELKHVLDGDVLGTQRLELWSSSWFNWTVLEFSLKVVFPPGSSFKSDSGFSDGSSVIRTKGTTGSGLLKLIRSPYREWTYSNPTEIGSLIIKIDYDAGYLWIANSPLIFSFGFFLLGLTYVGARTIRFGGEAYTEVKEIPYELIENYVRTYEEKTAIRERVRRLDKQRKSGKATDREYQKAKRILQNKLTAIERNLVDSTRTLAKKGRAYESFTHSIEVAEAEREDVLANLERLEKRKTAGRIGKDAYRRLKNNYERRLKKANNTVDRVLIELRSFMPE